MHDRDLLALQHLRHVVAVDAARVVVAQDQAEDVVVALLGELGVAGSDREERDAVVLAEHVALRDGGPRAVAADQGDDLLGDQVLGCLDADLRVALVVGLHDLDLGPVDPTRFVERVRHHLGGVDDVQAGRGVVAGERPCHTDLDDPAARRVRRVGTAGGDQQDRERAQRAQLRQLHWPNLLPCELATRKQAPRGASQPMIDRSNGCVKGASAQPPRIRTTGTIARTPSRPPMVRAS